MSKKNGSLNFKNPVIAAQVLESPFVADPYLGHTMPPGKDFIGEKNYIPLDEIISEIKNSKKKVILNIGDSSTSGWDSNIVTQNRERLSKGQELLPAFFNYKTYSDFLRDYIGDQYIVINAGVPAHTSLQGARRLPLLLNHFKKNNIQIDLVTAYYGNNDSVWDHNREDKQWVGKRKNFLRDFINKFQKSDSQVTTRVSSVDYKKNMKEIVRICRTQHIKIILIEPITPIYWKPGTRVLNEDLPRINYPGSHETYKLLDEALELWSHAVQEGSYSELKRVALEEAREKDFIVPRIKKNHLKMFAEVLEETKTPSIHVNLNRTENDIRYFIDYCHPINKANALIAESIQGTLAGTYEVCKPILREKISSFVDKGNLKLDIPTTHYTLY